jgi:hypothetical protein
MKMPAVEVWEKGKVPHVVRKVQADQKADIYALTEAPQQWNTEGARLKKAG